jgi:hypothetical protein
MSLHIDENLVKFDINKIITLIVIFILTLLSVILY